MIVNYYFMWKNYAYVMTLTSFLKLQLYANLLLYIS